MTRINVVPVEELTDQHLGGEWKEFSRPFTYANDHNIARCDWLREIWPDLVDEYHRAKDC